MRDHRLYVRLSEADLAALDTHRGDVGRSEYIRQLINQDMPVAVHLDAELAEPPVLSRTPTPARTFTAPVKPGHAFKPQSVASMRCECGLPAKQH